MEYQHIVEDYVEGSLSTDEKAAFEAALKTNTGLQQAVEDERIFHHQMEHLRLRNVVRAALAQPEPSFGYKKRLLFYTILIVLVGLASYIYYPKPLPPKPIVVPTPSVQTPVATTENKDSDIRYGSSPNEAVDVKEETPSKLPFVGIGVLLILSILATEGYFYYQKKRSE